MENRREGVSDRATPFEPSDQEIEALTLSIHRKTRPLKYLDDEEAASSVSIALGSRYFLATAGHLLREQRPMMIVRKQGQDAIKLSQVRRVCWEDDPIDLGLIEMTRDQASRIEEFLGARDIRITPPISDSVLVSGFPAANWHREGWFQVATGSTLSSVMVPLPKLPHGIEPIPDDTRDLYVQHPERLRAQLVGPGFPVDEGTLRETPAIHPGGLSGGGIWHPAFKRRGTNGVLYPAPELLAIQVGYFSEARLLRGVLIEHWLNLVGREYPDLREEIARIKGRKGT